MPITDKVFSDGFTGVAGTPLSSHVPDVGTGWCYLENTVGAPSTAFLQINAGGTGLDASSAADSSKYTYATRERMTSPDVKVQVTVTTKASTGGTDDPFWLLARITNSANFYGAGSHQGGLQRIYKRVGGVTTQIATLAGAIANADYFEFYLIGSRLELHKNGALVLAVSDSALPAAGHSGFGMGAVFVDTDDTNTTWVFDDYGVWVLRHLVRADNFTDPDDTDLRLHAPDQGSMWGTSYIVSSVYWEIVSNGVQSNTSYAGGSLIAVLHPEMPGCEYAVEVSLPVITALTGVGIGVCARYTNPLNYYAGGTFRGGDANDKRIYKWVAGVCTLVAQADSGLTAGDTLRLEVENGAQRLYHNNVLVVSGADTALTEAGYAGIVGGEAFDNSSMASTSYRLDNFKVWLFGGPLSRDEGGVAKAVKVLAADAGYAVCSRDYCVVATPATGDVTITLPPAGQQKGRKLEILNISDSGFQVIIDPDGSELIEGAATFSFMGPGCAIAKSDGTQWWVVAAYYPMV